MYKQQLFFQDPNQITTFDEDHSDAEDRWITLGFDRNGILLVVIHTIEETERYMNIRIISARKRLEPKLNNMRNLTNESRI